MISTSLLPAFIIGIASAGHCLGMCGGLIVAAGFNSQRPSLVVIYNFGRIATYAILGFLVGMASSWLPNSVFPVLKWLSAALLILTALYLMGIGQAITKIEKIGLPIWRFVQPYTRTLLPVRSVPTAAALGLLWGLLPCGLIYTALAFSASQGSPIASASSMLAFGLGTLPIMLATGWMAGLLRPFLQRRLVRVFFAALLLATAAYIFFGAIAGH